MSADRAMSRYFIVPAILFDRGIYPRCFGLSEDAFRLYIYLCSAIGGGTCFSGHIAAKRYLGLDKNRFRVALDELLRNKLVIDCGVKKIGNRFTSHENYKKEKPKCKIYGIAVPPLISYKTSSSDAFLFVPEIELEDDKPPLFHTIYISHKFIRIPHQFVYAIKEKNKPRPLGYVAEMSTIEIDCYFSVLFSNSEYWFGVNPNYVRCEFSLLTHSIYEIENFMLNKWVIGMHEDICRINPVLMERTGQSKVELKEIINSLMIKYQLFEWVFWVAQYTTYSEERRSKEISQLIPRYYLGSQQLAAHRLKKYLKTSKISKRVNPSVLIGQLRSCLKLDSKFERIIKINCDRLGLPENIPKVRNVGDYPFSDEEGLT